MYLLTPTGIEAKSGITLRFLKAKMQEYESLQAEITMLMQETKSEFKLNQPSSIDTLHSSLETNVA